MKVGNKGEIDRLITGPECIVGPALMYDGDMISVMVAHGKRGTPGQLVEFKLGEWAGEISDALYQACDFVAVLRSAGEIDFDEARDMRADIIASLRRRGMKVQVKDTDLTLAQAYAETFPSDQSREVLDGIIAEQAA